jgi:DNA helicase-2/ATP-dependent DNA helicase PcrA
MLKFLDELNPEQRLAAETTEGPVLILAGAGTGKTRAITYRMANLVSMGTPADAVLAVTFTNKAAEEMLDRVADLLLRAGTQAGRPWISTFHSLCARILRREALHAGLPKDFAIYDADDQIAVVKLVMAKLHIEDESVTPRDVLSRISYAKNHAQTPEHVRAATTAPDGRRVADVYVGYEALLKQSKAVDFDDLLLRTARLLREFAEVRERWRARFRYLHVDEYQDTNRVQYDLLRLLTNEKQNICVVGDEDQSIYRWRGADVSILLSFSQDFPSAKVIRLERNYRSTQKILDAAAAVVSARPCAPRSNKALIFAISKLAMRTQKPNSWPANSSASSSRIPTRPVPLNTAPIFSHARLRRSFAAVACVTNWLAASVFTIAPRSRTRLPTCA